MNRFANCCWTAAIAVMLLGVSLALAPSARASEPGIPDAAAGPINSTCPVMPGEAIDPRFTAVYKNVEVGLCCRRCLTKFEADPELYIANLPQFKTAAFETSKDEDHGQGDTGSSSHEHADSVENDHAIGEDHIADDVHDDASGGAAHDHASDHDAAPPRIITWLGEFHPPATDLPIALLLAASLAEGMLVVTKREMFRHAAAFCVSVAALGALGAATLGWFNGGFVLLDEDWVQATHRWLGTTTTILTLLTLALLWRSVRRPGNAHARRLYRIALFAATGLVMATGFFGGSLVYGLDHYAW
jgi:uncharacterized membrane protein